jgi:hypothetical protein
VVLKGFLSLYNEGDLDESMFILDWLTNNDTVLMSI